MHVLCRTVQVAFGEDGGVIACRIFSWHILEPLLPIKYDVAFVGILHPLNLQSVISFKDINSVRLRLKSLLINVKKN